MAKAIKCSLLSLGLFLLLPVGQALAVAGYADVGISSISPCPSFCGGSGGVSEFSFDGGPGFNSAATTLSNSNGNGEGFANLNGPTLLPVLGAGAFSNPNARVGVGSTGMRSYLYTGASPTTITLDIVFEGEASAPVANDASGESHVLVMKGNDFPFSTHYPTLKFEEIPLTPGLDLLGESNLFLTTNAGPQTLTDSISLDLLPGDKIAVWGNLNVRGTRSGSVDALNTLGSSFSDPTGLVPLPVPSPASATLLVVGLLGYGLRGNRTLGRG